MENEKYLQDIAEIKNMMNKSSRFLSLSGLSGILAGFYAIIGALLANNIIKYTYDSRYVIVRGQMNSESTENVIKQLFIIAAVVVILSIITGIVLSSTKAKKLGENLWDVSSKRLVIQFSIPLISGGLFALALLYQGYYGLIAPVTLIFYGLACVNASKYTLGDVKYLGLTMIVLGLISTFFVGYGLFFWAIGFGLCHIGYGFAMYQKYDRK
jgi:hypothetical protein